MTQTIVTHFDNNQKYYLVPCSCTDMGHFIILSMYDDEDDVPEWRRELLEPTIYIYLQPFQSFWRRLKNGLKYIFGSDKQVLHNALILNHETVGILEEFVNDYNKIIKDIQEQENLSGPKT